MLLLARNLLIWSMIATFEKQVEGEISMSENSINLVLNGVSFITSYIIFYMICRNMKIVKWASKKASRAIISILIALIFCLSSMSIARSINITGIYYNLLDGFFMGLFISAAVSIFIRQEEE